MANQPCLFCQIVNGNIPATIRYDSADFLVFDDINPVAPQHVLIVPKQHFTTLEDVSLADTSFHAELMKVMRTVAHHIGIAKNYKFFMNVGTQVQAVHHVHLHLYGGWPKDKPQTELDAETNTLIHA